MRKKIPSIVQSILLACFMLISLKPCFAAEKTLVLGLPTDPKTFNPLLAQETSSTEITGFLFTGLTRFDPQTGLVVGELASHWEVSPSGLEWTFSLRRGIRWSDGEPFTADDVLFTFKVLYQPDLMVPSSVLFIIDGKPVAVEKLDDYTVRFTLPSPFAPFAMALSLPLLPEHVLGKSLESGTFSSIWGINVKPESIVGTGPFTLEAYEGGLHVRLKKNPYYWKRDSEGVSLPYIDRILMAIIPSPEGRLLKFIEGEIDAYAMRGQDYPVLKPEEKKRGFKIYSVGAGTGSSFLAFNQAVKDESKKSWFQNLDFRKAIAHAIDRQSMLGIVFYGLGTLQCSPVSPSIPTFYNPDVSCYEYDAAKSRALLAANGFVDRDGDGILEDKQGIPVDFVLMTNADNPDRVQIAQILREDIAALGIRVHLLFLEFNAMVSKLVATGDWDAVLIGFTGSPDPHFGANVWRTQSSLHFWEERDPALVGEGQKRIDEIFAAAVGEMDTGKRKDLYNEWQHIVARTLPHIYTVLPEALYAVSDKLVHVEPTVLGGIFYNIEEIDLKS